MDATTSKTLTYDIIRTYIYIYIFQMLHEQRLIILERLSLKYFIWGHSFSTYAQWGRGSSKSVRYAYKWGGPVDASKYVRKIVPSCLQTLTLQTLTLQILLSENRLCKQYIPRLGFQNSNFCILINNYYPCTYILRFF